MAVILNVVSPQNESKQDFHCVYEYTQEQQVEINKKINIQSDLFPVDDSD